MEEVTLMSPQDENPNGPGYDPTDPKITSGNSMLPWQCPDDLSSLSFSGEEGEGHGGEAGSSSLSFRQQAALPIIASSLSLAEAARNSGIGLSTLRRWLNNPEFCEQLALLRRDASLLAIQKLQAMVPRSISVIAEVLDNADPALRLRAARCVMDYFIQLNQEYVLRAEIQELKESLDLM
jgi:hypothetical protein